MSFWSAPHLSANSECDAVWGRPSGGTLLFVAGSGFDPRATRSLQRLVEVSPRKVDALIIGMPDAGTDPAVAHLAQQNMAEIERLSEITGGGAGRQHAPVDLSDGRSLGRLISRTFQDEGWLDRYDEVILDVSAMPRSVFFPLVLGVLQRAHLPASDARHWPGDLHVSVCEDPLVDAAILEEGASAAAALGGFSRSARPAKPSTTIWIPVLGERAQARVETIYDELEPDETCPVLPWPATDPRRADRLVLEYRQLLFDRIRLEPRNLIYAAERNPFDLYRTLSALQRRYIDALSPLGPVAVILSSHSSKLLSLGVLLTAYENGLEVQHVSPGKYSLDLDFTSSSSSSDIYDLWLTGLPYR